MNERAGVEAGGRGGRAYVCIEARGAAIYLRSSVSESIDRQEEISREAEMLRGYIERRTHRLMEGAEEIIRFRSPREAGAAARYLKVLYPETRRELCAVFPATVRRYLQYTRGGATFWRWLFTRREDGRWWASMSEKRVTPRPGSFMSPSNIPPKRPAPKRPAPQRTALKWKVADRGRQSQPPRTGRKGEQRRSSMSEVFIAAVQTCFGRAGDRGVALNTAAE